MEQYRGNAESRNPMPSVFRQELRRMYEVRDEPLPSRLEQLLLRLPDAAQPEHCRDDE
jgi:hypothetical protein